MFNKKIILITGGTGSFGKEMLGYFLNKTQASIRVLSRDEKKQEDLRIKLNNPRVNFYIGDVREKDSMKEAFRDVDYIFHAAALKQVPSCEFYPMEAIKTNVIGSENVMSLSIEMNVEKVVFLSTDKAVYPINVMGQTKAMMEKLMIAKSRLIKNGKISFVATRYGNVMSSRGSVIPLFINQIINNNKITVTDPNMTRFLMSLKDSVSLVLEAFKSGVSGDIFVQKAPSAKIGDLAKVLKDILKKDNEIKIIGTRHSEKLYEVLMSREEKTRSQDFGNYIKISQDDRDLNYDNYFTKGNKQTSELDDYTSNNTKILKSEELRQLLLKEDIVNQTINFMRSNSFD